MQYGLCRVSKLNEKRYTTYTRQMWDLVLKMKGRRGKKPLTKLKQLYTYTGTITACAVATSCCISDEPCQWEKANFDPHSSDIY